MTDGKDSTTEPSTQWHRRHWMLAAALGAGLGVLGQVLVFAVARGELDATVTQRAAAVTFTTLAWVVAAAMVALLTQPLHARPWGRRAAVVVSGFFFAFVSLVNVGGVGLRLVSGTYLTAGAVSFSLNSSDHFLHAAAGDYLWTVVLFFAALAGLWFGFSRWLALVPSPKAPGKRALGVLAAAAIIAGVTYSQRSATRFTRGMFVGGPLVALVSSLDNDYELNRAHAQPEKIGAPLAPHGAVITQGEAWKTSLAAAKGERPNVVLIILESIARGHMSLYGYPRKTTPELDRLAKNSLHFTRAWTTATHSNYAQMAVLSSLFPRRVHGLDQYTRLDYPRFLYHDTFHTLGYQTATISSQDENWQGMRRFQDTGTPTHYWFSEDYTGQHLDSGVEKVVPDADTLDMALAWLKKPRKEPWAIYLNFQATHFPYKLPTTVKGAWQPSEPTPSTFTYLRYPESEKATVINRYDNALAYVDAQVGRLRKHLEDTGQLDDTLWIVTADHGEMFFEKGLTTHGRTIYDIESRVPLFFHWPKHIKPEERDEPVSNLDMMPTALDLLGLPPHPSWQGRSLVKADPDGVGKRPIYINIQGLRFADGLVCWPWKLILERTSKKPYLFRLDRDPDEKDNLIQAEPDVAERLTKVLSSQLIAQLDYHREKSKVRDKRFQPRLRRCPSLPSK